MHGVVVGLKGFFTEADAQAGLVRDYFYCVLWGKAERR